MYVPPAVLNTSSDGFGRPPNSQDFEAFHNVVEGAVPMSVMTLVPTPRNAPDTCADGDRDLLDALTAGDPTAWRDTVRRYEGLLRSAARVALRGDADVDEAVQRTWVLLFRNADRINDARCLPGWLSTTARREALAVLRGQQRAVPSEDVADHVAPDETDVAAALMDDELRRALDDAVETLPPNQRLVVRALLREPASYDAVSEELGIPRGSLGPLRGRAVRALRAQLEPSLR
jgi:RNA polymerase sigma factor (sigma-70 family)